MPTVIPVINCLYHLRYRRINNLTAILSILLLLLTNFYQVSTTFVFEDLLEPRPQEEPYNKFHRPGFNQSAVRVSVYIHLESMRDISSETTLDFYLIQFWQDPRVIPKIAPLKITGGDLPESIWYPDTYFQLVRSQIYSLEEQYIVASRTGKIEYNRKVRLTTPCSPDVMLFPFDIVTCSLMLSSFGYTADEVFYTWVSEEGSDDSSGNGKSKNVSVGELTTSGVHIDEKNNHVDHLGFYLKKAYTTHHRVPYGGANYSTLETVFLLQRKYSAYLMQVYLPAGLIVMLSWTIFWINVAATPARASLGVTTVLTMLTLATQSTAQNEKHVNRKLTAIDLYLWACFLFVIFAMLEFALSDYTTFRKNAHNKAAAANPPVPPVAPPNTPGGRMGPKSNSCTQFEHQYSKRDNSQKTAIFNTHQQEYINPHSIRIEQSQMLNGQQKLSQNHNQLSARHSTNNISSNKSLNNNNDVYPNHHIRSSQQSFNLQCRSLPQKHTSVFEQRFPITNSIEAELLRSAHHKQQPQRRRRLLILSNYKLRNLHKVNEWARWAFPLGFFIFNVCYWSVLLYLAKTRKYP
ncbi:gamma-aminobutyric acid receptor subunit rho-1-like [Convolutriloba macropyga]|uniref:gamma-aminobutyric acid receptor subunit rho-1-like n=1 Tax=Convolutriloba macropyga TaxID=536237 RepID=UPI003F527F81